MTIEKLNSLPHGTRVQWLKSGDPVAEGYVVDLRKSRPTAPPPLVYIQWDDGGRTDGRDDWGMPHVYELCKVQKAIRKARESFTY